MSKQDTHKAMIGKYFKDTPGCIVNAYSVKDAQEVKLQELEEYCQDSSNWFLHTQEQDGDQTFYMYLISFEKLKKHDYTDEDAVKICIWEDANGVVAEFSLELH